MNDRVIVIHTVHYFVVSQSHGQHPTFIPLISRYAVALQGLITVVREAVQWYHLYSASTVIWHPVATAWYYALFMTNSNKHTSHITVCALTVFPLADIITEKLVTSLSPHIMSCLCCCKRRKLKLSEGDDRFVDLVRYVDILFCYLSRRKTEKLMRFDTMIISPSTIASMMSILLAVISSLKTDSFCVFL